MKHPILAITMLCGVQFLGFCSSAAFEIQKVVSPRGIEAWLVEDHNLPLFALSVAWMKNPDPKNYTGTTAMMASLLDQGSGDMDWEEFRAQLEESYISMRFDTSYDALYGEMRSLTKNKDVAFKLFAQAITKPRFDRQAISRIRRQFLTLARHRDLDLTSFARSRWYEEAFGNQPYAFPIHGRAQDIRKIKRLALLSRHQKILTRRNLFITIVGDITAAELAPILDQLFGQLPEGSKLRTRPKQFLRKSGKLIRLKRNSPQTIIYFGLPGIKRDHSDFIPYYVMNHILGGSSSSLLFQTAREKYSLVYAIHSRARALRATGFILGSAATRNHQTKRTIRLIRRLFARLRKRGVSQKELDQAKTYLIGSYGLNFDYSLAVANNLTSIQIHKLGIDYPKKREALINQVSKNDVNRQIKRFLDPKKMIILTAGGKNNSHSSASSSQRR